MCKLVQSSTVFRNRKNEIPFLSSLVLAVLVGFLFLFRKGAPHFPELLAGTSERNAGIVLLDLFAVLLGEQHESRKRLCISFVFDVYNDDRVV